MVTPPVVLDHRVELSEMVMSLQLREKTLPTIRPDPCRCAYNLPDIFLMVDDCANTQAGDCEGRCVSRRVQIRFWKRIDIFRVRHGYLELAPGNLGETLLAAPLRFSKAHTPLNST
jgi:hypothetical protein